MFFASGIWCVADVSSVSPSSEQTQTITQQSISLLRQRANARNVSYTPNSTVEKHTISIFVDQTRFLPLVWCIANVLSASPSSKQSDALLSNSLRDINKTVRSLIT